MNRPQPHRDNSPKAIALRLDRMAGELNAFLTIFAIGLAVLYGSCFFGIKVTDAVIHASTPMTQLTTPQQISAAVR